MDGAVFFVNGDDIDVDPLLPSADDANAEQEKPDATPFEVGPKLARLDQDPSVPRRQALYTEKAGPLGKNE